MSPEPLTTTALCRPTGAEIGRDHAAPVRGEVPVQAAIGVVVAGQRHFVVAVAGHDHARHDDTGVGRVHSHGGGRGVAGGKRGRHLSARAEIWVEVAVVGLARIDHVAGQAKLSVAGRAGHKDVAVVQGDGVPWS